MEAKSNKSVRPNNGNRRHGSILGNRSRQQEALMWENNYLLAPLQRPSCIVGVYRCARACVRVIDMLRVIKTIFENITTKLKLLTVV